MSEPPKWAPLPRAPGRQQRWTRLPEKPAAIDVPRDMPVHELIALLNQLPATMRLTSMQGFGRHAPGRLRFRPPDDEA
jgi:hypothetical protein